MMKTADDSTGSSSDFRPAKAAFVEAASVRGRARAPVTDGVVCHRSSVRPVRLDLAVQRHRHRTGRG
jgi:hypothetical protein